MEPVPSLAPPQNGNELNPDGIASLLAMARQRINEGNPSLALQAVVLALRASGGERAVLQALGRAREMYRTKRQSNEAVDELSALFAECALATDFAAKNVPIASGETQVGPPVPPLLSSPLHPVAPSEEQDMAMMDHSPGMYQSSAPILAESGRLQVVMDASSDGSSFVCVHCGGVVSNQRKDEHFTFWCSRESR
ncbi:unnamed protein product [Calypogeia fissa]